MHLSRRFAATTVFLIVLCIGTVLLRYSNGGRNGISFIAEVAVAGAEDNYDSIPLQAQTAETVPQPMGSVRGKVVDEGNSPVAGVEVEIIPADERGDRRWYATKPDWTNQDGGYKFGGLEAGEYLLAVQIHAGPDGSHPFAGVYYPSADDEAGADHLFVGVDELELLPIRMRRIETAILTVEVIFEDGTHPRWSNLLFYNPSFPEHGVIGDEAPGIANGQGQITLPEGFEYYARAKVDCDAGSRIETRESRPILQVKIEEGTTPKEVTFVIPGPACSLWSPR